MARQCDLCGKHKGRGNKVSHAHNVSRRTWEPNLQNVRAVVAGRSKQLRVCTRCIRSNKVQKAPPRRRPAAQAAAL